MPYHLANKDLDFIKPYIDKLRVSTELRILFKFNDPQRLKYLIRQAIALHCPDLAGKYQFRLGHNVVLARKVKLTENDINVIDELTPANVSELETFAEIAIYMHKNRPIAISFPFSAMTVSEIEAVCKLGFTYVSSTGTFHSQG